MLTGTVNDFQPWLAVDLLAIGGQYLSVEVVLDTGFNGELAMPASVIPQLDLVPRGNRYTYLAVGSWTASCLSPSSFAANAPP